MLLAVGFVCSLPGCNSVQTVTAAPEGPPSAAKPTQATTAPESRIQAAPVEVPAATVGPVATGSPAAEKPSPAVAALAPQAKLEPTVTRIVFLGKKHACACTQKAIEASSKALEARLGNSKAIPIERFEIDVDPEGARRYYELKPMMALPALYFLDGKGQLVGMLQGEVSPTSATRRPRRSTSRFTSPTGSCRPR
jgi:hypothetical protein